MPEPSKAHEMAERFVEEFGKDCKKMRVFKHDNGNARVDGQAKRFIPKDEFKERVNNALKGMDE